MPHITSIERLSRQEGRQEGRQEDILDIVEARFGEVPYTLREHILAVGDETELKRLLRQSALVNTLADFCALIAQPPAQEPSAFLLFRLSTRQAGGTHCPTLEYTSVL